MYSIDYTKRFKIKNLQLLSLFQKKVVTLQQKSSKPQKGFSEKQGQHRRNVVLTHIPILINKEDIMVSEAFKNRTRDEIIAAFRESIRKKNEWQERAEEEIRQIRKERQQFSI